MGWLWGSSDTTPSGAALDPSLRSFLEKEAPSGPKPSLPPKKPAADAAKPAEPSQNAAQEAPAAPAVPSQSHFQDGRYAHLWKNYTPQNILEDRSKSDQDRLRDIVDAYNDRKAEIGRVAMENCALEYMAQFECFKNPNWTQLATICHAESRKFNRCYDLQAKFLKALGYLTMEDRSKEESDRIQMHADKLYQRLMEQEALIEKAKEEGKPLPKFESVLSKENIAQAMGQQRVLSKTPAPSEKPPVDDEEIWSHIRPTSRQEYEKKIAALPPEEQEIERSALLGELRAQTGMAKQVEEAFVVERIERMKRREAGQATIGDTIKRLWGWG